MELFYFVYTSTTLWNGTELTFKDAPGALRQKQVSYIYI